MHDEVIAHMRERIAQLGKIRRLAHDPRMIETIDAMIQQMESDLRVLEEDATPTD